ncbi:MAG: hypothetical protein F4X72_01305 [Dehalococcoidia bacterium]|nr:hypothetical protein [Dehalococcoidia bacterium]
MHWVDRGEEPPSLHQVRKTLTPKWIAYYRDRIGKSPSDARWQEFREELGARFHDICGYCEEIERGQVDHFRPKSKFPELVYEWSNWVFACNACNSIFKRDKWPEDGYVDPCASSRQERPENYFQFDLQTADLIPRSGLSGKQLRMARQTIRDISLNEHFHIQKRIAKIELVKILLTSLVENPRPEVERYIKQLTSRSRGLRSHVGG